jgi:hypothetical protein
VSKNLNFRGRGMFNCLKNDLGLKKKEVYVGFKFVIKRIYLQKTVFVKCTIISNSHPNYYLVKVQSNFRKTFYTKTIHKIDFPEHFYENMILTYKGLSLL